MEQDKTIGAITWMDITVPEADGLRDFYKNVVGWNTMDISMGDYNDYCMVSPSDNVVRSGVCHAAGANAGMPAAWIMYINVANLDESIARVIARSLRRPCRRTRRSRCRRAGCSRGSGTG